MARETGLNRNAITLLYKETARRVELDALDSYANYSTVGWGICSSLTTIREDRKSTKRGRKASGIKHPIICIHDSSHM
ncbi:helix-turn-helix domain-containing protein [Vreelandella venusta]|uniref:helix-turn-helix domain-containing protein n=1 Tax=Vreelandella venusta TaxID=44935 RepID=UPI0035581944